MKEQKELMQNKITKKACEDRKIFENHSPILHVMTTGEKKTDKTASGLVVCFSHYI